MPVNVAQLVVSVGANTAMAEQGIMGLARMLGTGGPLALGALGAGAVIVGVIGGATKMAGDFQTQLTQLVTGAGEAQSNLGLISSGVLQMARDTGTSTKQLTDGLYMIESAGYHGQAGLDILKAAAEGAKVGASDLGTTADAVTTILKDYGNTGLTAAQATNTLIATVANGKTHMQDLAGALSAVLPAASAAGIGLNDVMAAMAAQTAAGVPAADASTHLRQLLIALQAPSAAAKKALGDVGLTTDQVAAAMHKSLPDALQMIQQHLATTYGVGTPKYLEGLKNISGGMREMQGMLLLTSTNGMASFQSSLKNISGQVKTGGDQIQGWTLVQGTFNQSMAKLGEIFGTLMIILGTQLLPVATQFANFLASNLGPIVDSLTGKNKDFSKGLGGDLLKAAKDTYNFFKSDVHPIMKQLGDLWTKTIVPILHTFAEVLIKHVLPAIEPVAKTIAEKWMPPLIRITNDILPVLNPILQWFGWLFQNVIGPGLNMAAGAVGSLLGGLADLLDGISNFVHNPSVSSLQGIMKGIANFGTGSMNVMTGGVFSHFLPHFAAGGLMDTSGPALVGEAGPEIVMLPGGAQVTPIGSLAGGPLSMPANYGGYGGYGASGGGTQTIIVQIDGRVAARAIVPHLPDVIRTGTGTRAF